MRGYGGNGITEGQAREAVGLQVGLCEVHSSTIFIDSYASLL